MSWLRKNSRLTILISATHTCRRKAGVVGNVLQDKPVPAVKQDDAMSTVQQPSSSQGKDTGPTLREVDLVNTAPVPSAKS